MFFDAHKAHLFKMSFVIVYFLFTEFCSRLLLFPAKSLAFSFPVKYLGYDKNFSIFRFPPLSSYMLTHLGIGGQLFVCAFSYSPRTL